MPPLRLRAGCAAPRGRHGSPAGLAEAAPTQHAGDPEGDFQAEPLALLHRRTGMEAEDVLGEAKAGWPGDGLDRLRPVGPEDLRIGLRGEGAELMREGPPRMTAADEAVRAGPCTDVGQVEEELQLLPVRQVEMEVVLRGQPQCCQARGRAGETPPEPHVEDGRWCAEIEQTARKLGPPSPY